MTRRVRRLFPDEYQPVWFVCRYCGDVIHEEFYEDLLNSLREHLIEKHGFHPQDANYVSRGIVKSIIRMFEDLKS